MNTIKDFDIKEKIKSVIDDYNDIAEEYCNDFGNDDSYNGYIKKWLNDIKCGKILDAGCGCANNCAFIGWEGNFDCVGIDFSDNMLEEAGKRNPECKVMKMDMTDLKFDEGSFDGVLSNCSFMHVPVELVEKTLKGFWKVLKDDGKLLLMLSEGSGEKMMGEPYRAGQGVYVYTKYYSIEEITGLLSINGFSVKNVDALATEGDAGLSNKTLIIYAQKEG